MKLISWNVNHRVAGLAEQASRLAGERPDLVALQEVTAETATGWERSLGEAELVHTLTSLHPHGQRPYGNLIASRWPLERLREMEIPLPERGLSARVSAPGGDLELHVVHVPPGVSTGIKKVETFEGVYRRLGRPSPLPRVLCGDFNSPQAETAEGELFTWGQDRRSGKFVPGRGERWDAAERSVLEGLAAFDLEDVFRRLHGYRQMVGETAEGSWIASGAAGPRGRRFDHVLASGRLSPRSARYIHEWREDGLSDHSPVEVVFAGAPKQAAAGGSP